MNDVQERFIKNRHGRDVVVKARQLGFSTLIDIDILDDVIFNSDFNGLVIAHTLPDAQKLFRTKIKFPYDHLPEGLKTALYEESETTQALAFKGAPGIPHDSRIDVSVSGRGGTVHNLHVSEMGKIAIKNPAHAQEILTGAFEAVPLTGRITVESTAEGAWGAFYDLAKAAKDKQDAGDRLTKLDFKLHFEPWWKDPENLLSAVITSVEVEEYCESLLRNHGIMLTPEQASWYAGKLDILGDRMLQENPSTFDEAFHVAIKGAYYAKEMSRMRLEKRIGRVTYDPNYPVFTGWDLGQSDATSIWWGQMVGGAELRLIDYYENSQYGVEHYVREVLSRPYIYDTHYIPHDGRRRSFQSAIENERLDQTMRRLGLRPLTIVPRAKSNYEIVVNLINTVRRFLATASIDARKCEQGIKCLDAYSAEWDEERGVFKQRPLHDWSSHGADALRTLAVGMSQRYGMHRPPSEDGEPDDLEDY